MKRYLSLLLALVLVFTSIPVTALTAAAAEDIDGVITAEKVVAQAGETVTMNLTVQNNPGILGMTLQLNFDESKVTLVNVAKGEALSYLTFTAPKAMISGCKLVWDGEEVLQDKVTDGVIATLTFQIAEDAPKNEEIEILVSSYGDIIDNDAEALNISIVNGTVRVIDYKPGDANGDNDINTTDVVYIRRAVAGGYGVTINEAAADVNDDGLISSTDLVWIRRFVAEYPGVILKPSTPRCKHTMEFVAYKEATCEETGIISHYHCTSCGKYFSDEQGKTEIAQSSTVLAATGHTAVTDPYVAPTYDSVGWKEGSHCDVCKKVLVAQEEIPMLEKDTYNIIYNLTYNDPYLQSIEIENPNPDVYAAQDGMKLEEPVVAGYIFEGWYDGQGSSASRVTEIPEGTTGTIRLYAHWSLVEYEVQFHSPLTKEVEKKTFTVNTGVTLTNPEWYGYNFVGWTNEEGTVVTSIPVGTARNITLTANWSSKRNQTIPVKTLGDPMIIEQNGLILFVYEIGRIENIPLQTIASFTNSNGLTWTEETQISLEINNSEALEVAKTITDATTTSSSWTLSEGWNQYTEQSKEYAHETTTEVQQNAKSAYETNGQWTVSKNSGGSSTVSQETGVSSKVSATVGSEVEVDAGIGVKAGISAELGTEIGEEYKDTQENSKTWNTESGYSSGYSASQEFETSYSVSQAISQKYGYTQSYGSQQEWEQANGVSVNKEESREYGSSVVFSKGTTETKTRTYTNEGSNPGFYRLVAAGTAHVFGVVGYDMATGMYFTYSYTVMDEEVKDYVDYSATTSEFDDQENGVLPFDIPFEVNDYVDRKILATNGLTVDLDTGIINGYTGTATHVRVPTYMAVDNDDGTYSVVKVTGIDSKAFQGKDHIVEITLPDTVTAIPDSAFAGCTSLKTVKANSIQSIGANAFQGCVSLENYQVSTAVKELGTNAFEGALSVTIYAYNAAVAKAAAECGAKNLTINMATMADELSDYTFQIGKGTEYFALQGGTKSYTGVRVVSDAAETVLNGMSLSGCSDTPLVLSSAKVTLNRVNVNASGLTMVLSADSTEIALFGNNSLISSSADAVRSNTIALTLVNPTVSSKVSVNGNVLVCGTCANTEYMPVENGKIICYNLTDTCLVTFDGNGGTCDEGSRVVPCGTAIGELPEASNAGYVFYGWVDANGNAITADTMFYEAGEIVLYANWIEPYTINWEVGTGYTISVTRTASPKGKAAIGTLNAGDSIYPEDVLVVEYAPTEGYTITDNGVNTITVTGNVTGEQIFAEVDALNYTYDIIYKSSNGTLLGTATVTNAFNTAHTIAPKDYSGNGYTAPAPQTVEWDSTTAKTITFVYTPIAVATTQQVTSGTWWYHDSNTGITYVTKVSYRNRTATNVQIQVVWSSTITNGRYGYTQEFNASSNGVGTGNVQITTASTWNTAVNGARTQTVYSKWITVPVNTTNRTSISISGAWWDALRSGGWSGTYTIPAY